MLYFIVYIAMLYFIMFNLCCTSCCILFYCTFNLYALNFVWSTL